MKKIISLVLMAFFCFSSVVVAAEGLLIAPAPKTEK